MKSAKGPMYRIIVTNSYDKDIVKCAKRGLDLDMLKEVVKYLRDDGTVPRNHRPHILSGNMQGYWECHVKSDWLSIWLKNEDQKTIILIGTGTHSDLF